MLTPILVLFLLLVGNSRNVMGNYRLGWRTNTGRLITVLVMVAAAFLFYGLFTGQNHSITKRSPGYDALD